MIFLSFCASIWLKNIEKMLLQMTSSENLHSAVCNRSFVSVNFISTFSSNFFVIIYLRLGTASLNLNCTNATNSESLKLPNTMTANT
jgi:hypothetical protein